MAGKTIIYTNFLLKGGVHCIQEGGEELFECDEDSSENTVEMVFRIKGDEMVYIYDFGDDWQHLITVEAIEEGNLLRPILMAGIGECPPEDCGGVWAYAELKDEEELDADDFDLENSRFFLNELWDD